MIVASNGIKHRVTNNGRTVRIESSIDVVTSTEVNLKMWLAAGDVIKETHALRLWMAFYSDISEKLLALHTLACMTHAPQEVVDGISELLLMLEDNRREATSPLDITTRNI